MEKKFTEQEIKKALEQANANIELEEIVVPIKSNDETKTLKKEFKNERNRRSN